MVDKARKKLGKKIWQYPESIKRKAYELFVYEGKTAHIVADELGDDAPDYRTIKAWISRGGWTNDRVKYLKQVAEESDKRRLESANAEIGKNLQAWQALEGLFFRVLKTFSGAENQDKLMDPRDMDTYSRAMARIQAGIRECLGLEANPPKDENYTITFTPLEDTARDVLEEAGEVEE